MPYFLVKVKIQYLKSVWENLKNLLISWLYDLNSLIFLIELFKAKPIQTSAPAFFTNSEGNVIFWHFSFLQIQFACIANIIST